MTSVRQRRVGGGAAFALALALVAGCSPDGDLGEVRGRLVLTPARADLGRVPRGLRVGQPLELQNRGDGALDWSASLPAPRGGLSLSARSGRLGPGQRATLELSLIAGEVGPMATAIRFATNSEASPEVLLPVSAEITPEILDVAPAALDFGPVRTDREVVRTVVVTNLGPDRIRLQPNLLDAPPELTLRDDAPADLAPQATARFELAYAPDREGPLRATLTLVGDCTPSCEVQVPLTGHAVPSSVVCAPEVVDFGAVNLHTCGQVDLVCTNTADAEVRLEAATLDPQAAPFSADPPPLPAPLAPGEAVTVEVSFCPDEARVSEGLFTLDVLEADVGPRRTTAPVRGRGGGPNLAVSKDLVDFGGAVVGARRARTLELRNVGDAPLALGPPRIAPEGLGFTLASPLPDTLLPGEAHTVALELVAQVEGRAVAELVLDSDDPDTPERRITLTAEVLPPGQCTARLAPEAVGFGLLGIGASNEVDIELSAGDDGACAWFDPRVEGARFTLVDRPSRSGRVPPGGRARFTVRYEASEASPPRGDLGVFRIDVPHARPDELQVPLTGLAADNDLVVVDDDVDFGPRPIGLEHTSTLHVYNTGEQTHRLTAIEGYGDAALELAHAPTPIVLRPDEVAHIDLRWRPTAPGALRAFVHLTSDRLPAAIRVPVQGEATDGACGHVAGALCAPHGRWDIAGAEVTVRDAAGYEVTTTTDHDGRFFAHCLSPGQATLTARRGHYRATVPVSVSARRVTALPAGTCLAPPPAASVAVVTGEYDRVGLVLDGAGVGYSIVSGHPTSPGLLTDRDLLLSYEMVFLNCGFEDAAARDPAVAENLRAFVAQGGSLYVSDQAYDAVEGALPNMLELAGDDAQPDAAEVGRALRLEARALDPATLRVLGRARIDVELDGLYAVVDSAAAEATVHLAAPTSGPGAGLKPLAVTYRPPNALGRVVYTTVHESALLVDPELRALLEHLVFSL